MSRYHKEFKFNNGIHELLLPDIHKYLLDEGYDYRVFEGENVYKKGSGWATAPTFVKITASTTGHYRRGLDKNRAFSRGLRGRKRSRRLLRLGAQGSIAQPCRSHRTYDN